MGKLIEFSINFTNIQQPIFFPGQTICGVVVVNLSDSMNIRGIALQRHVNSQPETMPLDHPANNLKPLQLNFNGKANVHWSESQGSGEDQRTVHYRASETYFNTTVSLVGKGSGGSTENSSQLSIGQSVFPFSFQLPSNIPTSFEGVHGYVRYFIKATIDKPWKFNHNTKVAFTVISALDLNQDPNSKNQVTANKSKTLCCLCCASGPIQAEVNLNRSGYVPGELILVNASVDNLSTSDMPSTKAELVQIVKYHATSKTRPVEKVVASISGEGCRPRESITWNNKQLQIPPLPSSMLQFCRIIDIMYLIRFVVVVPFGSFNLKASVPITIGSIPLVDAGHYNRPVPPVDTAPPSVPSAPPLPEATSFQPPPPSYVAAVGAPVNIKDDDDNNHLMGRTSFAPQYAYYDWNQSAVNYS